ncbi:TTF-type zinc finger protein with HAT dimerization domain [Zea mays]|uniref:TTF-type zinc finger protein with HAT dimerization domain n=1 Tax=Zea mays TaxID=4577 RepID=A0A1D6J4P0_MAIZE|nr:TTF-type zinc finger protein with HAT dimerization domain [Zea mays]
MGNSGSGHKYSVGCFNNLKNSMAHIDKVVVKENEKLVAEARLRLTTTINSISSSTKRNDELLAAQAEEIAREIELGELDTGQGALQIIVKFDFVFILLLMEMITKITDEVNYFYEKNDIDILDLNHKYVSFS